MDRRSFLTLCSAVAAVGSASVNGEVKSAGLWKGYDKAVVIDGLSSAFDYHGEESSEGGLASREVEAIKRSGISLINATIPYPGDDFEASVKKVAAAHATVRRYNDIFSLINNSRDILKCKADGKVGIAMGFQSVEMIGSQLQRIAMFSNLGVRIMQLTYNQRSQFGDGGLSKENRGITTLGKKAIEQMELHKVLVDLSHSGQRTVADAIKLSNKPLAITHTGCNEVYEHPRNNDDAELRAVAERGGVVGIYLMPFLWGGTGEITAEMVLAHIDHAIKVCGEEHVGIGSDQGIVPVDDTPQYREMIRQEVLRRKAAGISAPGETPDRPPFVADFNSERRMDMIAHALSKRGYKSAVIEKVIGGNFFRLFREVWG